MLLHAIRLVPYILSGQFFYTPSGLCLIYCQVSSFTRHQVCALYTVRSVLSHATRLMPYIQSGQFFYMASGQCFICHQVCVFVCTVVCYCTDSYLSVFDNCYMCCGWLKCDAYYIIIIFNVLCHSGRYCIMMVIMLFGDYYDGNHAGW